MTDDDLLSARQTFVEEVYIWVLGNGATAEGVIREAYNLLVAGADGGQLAELAGLSPSADYWDVLPLARGAMEELGFQLLEPETEAAQMTAFRAQASRTVRGEITPRDFAAWTHRVIGHSGPAEAQPVVIADDEYDDCGYSPESEVDAEVLRLAREFSGT